MLQNVRDNMKGTLVIVVIILFIVPMVVGGVGSSFLGSAAGTDAAKVEGKSVSNFDVSRAIYSQRQRIMSQTGADASADYLSDENLRGPVLQNLTRRLALVRTAEKSGMAISDEAISKEITSQEYFKTDNKFDAEKYRQLLRRQGSSPAKFKEDVAGDLLLAQQNFGLDFSSFVTPSELDALLKIVQQKRSFYSVKIPKALVEESVAVEADEIQAYYDANNDKFIDSEKVKLSYLDLSIEELAKEIEVSEEEIKTQYDQEAEAFRATTRYEIAHILVEAAEDGSHTTKLDELSKKIADGESFSELAKTYSDDVASKEAGGDLGVMTLGMFPEAFETAVLALDEGQVSAPVETDSGTHFIKANKKVLAEVPSFESRKELIKTQLATAVAEERFIESLDLLGEYTFGAADLAEAADKLQLSVKTTELFERGSGTGLAKESSVREAAFSSELLAEGENSSVLELGADRAVVVRVLEHQEEKIKDFAEVQAEIKAQLVSDKIDAELSLLAEVYTDKVRGGEDAEALAKTQKYEFNRYDAVKRQDVSVDRELLAAAFDVVAAQNKTTYDNVQLRHGDRVVLALESVVDGSRSDLEEQELKSLKKQLASENSRFESAGFEALVVEDANIELY